MAAAGVALGIVAGVYWLARWRRPRLAEHRLMLLAVAASGPLAFATIEAGWIVTEVGRQPWIIYHVMRTQAAITGSPLVGVMFVLFSALYVALTLITVVALRSEMRLLPRRTLAPHSVTNRH
jgi:cytochrome d ubiquinol oxidase subunit I